MGKNKKDNTGFAVVYQLAQGQHLKTGTHASTARLQRRNDFPFLSRRVHVYALHFTHA